MKIRIRFSYLFVGVILLVALAVVFVILHFVGTSGQSGQTYLPLAVQYALEYFNAATANKTLLVPSQYYSAAEALAINNNVVVSNQTLYNSVLFGSGVLPQNEYILIDMGALSGLQPPLSVTAFPTNYTTGNLSSSLRNCVLYRNSTDAMALCSVYPSNLSNAVLGNALVATFPGASSITYINSTILYNGTGSLYVPSYVNPTTAGFKNGTMFIYENTSSFYVPYRLMKTFYGREMFLPAHILGNVFANFYDARIVS